MGLPLLCLIAVSTAPLSTSPTPHPPFLTSATTPTPQPLHWPLANPSYSGFRVRAADSQPIGRLPRGADAAVSSRRDVRDPRTQKRGEAAVCLQHLKFREGRSATQAYTEHDERAVQYINKCHIKRSVWFFHCSQTAEWRQIEEWNAH